MNIKEAIEVFALRLELLFNRIKLPIKYFLQRRIRGFDNPEWIDLDVSIARFLVPRLKHLKDHGNKAYPIELWVTFRKEAGEDKSDELLEDHWNTVLEKMIEGFEEVIIQQNYDSVETTNEEWEESEKKIDRALILFCKYYNEFWD